MLGALDVIAWLFFPLFFRRRWSATRPAPYVAQARSPILLPCNMPGSGPHRHEPCHAGNARIALPQADGQTANVNFTYRGTWKHAPPGASPAPQRRPMVGRPYTCSAYRDCEPALGNLRE